MSFAGNPFVSAPRLPSPVKKNKRLSLHARSASRSPARPRDVDSLLRDLSPTTTLRAFRADPNSPDMAFGGSNADILARSIESSSESERALGAKAAQSCLDLRTWLREMEGWTWPGSFDVPESARKRMRLADGIFTGEDGKEYWGSLPAETVRAYEQRADEIGQLLDEMDVEELKEYVLSSHYRANSRPPSRSRRLSTMSTLDLVTSDMKRLDDFTALVTATILQALPFLSHLNRLLDVWTIRLIILRSAPNYLRDLERARGDLDQGWAAISASSTAGATSNDVTIDRQAVFQLRSSFERQVGTLGRKLDRFLDDLEGREDRVPDSWIDDFENLEAAIGAWVAQADRRVLESEWRMSRDSQSARTMVRDSEQVSELEVPSLDADAVRRLSVDTSLSNEPFANFDQVADVNMRSLSPSFDAVPIPVLQQDNLSPQSINSNTRSISERLALGVEEPPSNRSVSDSAAHEEGGGGLIAKRRAAFLNDIERTNSLKLASKSPVRSFEHASNAFTRLFKKDRSPEKVRPVPKRSGSSKSGFSSQLNTVIGASMGSSSNLSPQGSAETPRSESATEATELPATIQSSGRPDSVVIDDSATLAQLSANAKDITSDPPEPVFQIQDAAGLGYNGPETYKPSRLSSPFASPNKTEVPEDWPLNHLSDTALDQNQQIQDEGVVSSPFAEPASAVDLPEPGPSRNTDVVTEPPFTEETENSEHNPPWLTDSHGETGSPTVPLQTDAFDRMFVQTLPQSPSETPGSANAPERPAPWTGSRRRHSLPRPQRGNIPGLLRRSSISSSYLDNEYESTSPTALTPSSTSSPDKLKIIQTEEDERKWVKRASATFIEAFPRSELKSINVSRPSTSPGRSTSAPTSAPPTLLPVTSPVPAETAQALNTTPLSDENAVAGATSPARHSKTASVDEDSTLQSTPSLPTESFIGESSPVPAAEPESPLQSAPLNAAMMKRRGNNNVIDESKMPIYTLSPASPSKKATQSRQGEDSFDRHVSEVLNALPAPIKFRSRPGAETPVHRASLGPRPKNPPTSRAPSRTGMMIAPAESSPKKSSSAADPEVKLYHLTQAGRDEPIKLFVRLVGEGERVMVRVGGGWADLADYLRQYAEHHGSRTVSDGGLEMQTALNNGHSRRISGPVELKARPAPSTPILESGGATPLYRPGSRDSEKDWASQQRPGSSSGLLRDMTNASSPFAARAQTPTLYGMNTRSSTPKSSSGSSNSRPSTANGAPGSSRPSSRQSTTNDGGHGLAGPSSTGKRGMLPDHKAKWVDSMIERAKASAEKSKEGTAKEKYFGELGKAGGTRRLVFRSGSGSGVAEKK